MEPRSLWEREGRKITVQTRERSRESSRKIVYISYIMIRLCGVVLSGDEEISVDRQPGWFNRGSSCSAVLGVQGRGYEWVCAVMSLVYAVIRIAAGLSGFDRGYGLWLAAETGRAVTSRSCSASAQPGLQWQLLLSQGFADNEKCPLSKLPHSRVRAPTLALVPLLRDVTCLSFLGPRRSYDWTNCPLTFKVLSWRNPLSPGGQKRCHRFIRYGLLYSIGYILDSEVIPGMLLPIVPNKLITLASDLDCDNAV